MALTQVTGPYPIFTDLDGSPLDDGYLYIGDANQDPETNPIQVFWDSALTIPATQPIRTNNGYAWRNGTPGLLYTAGEFSITIRNKRNEFVLYSPLGYGFDPKAASASVVKNDFTGDGVETDFTLSASPSTKLATNVFINGVYQEKDSYSLSGNVITFSIAPPLGSSIEILTNETGVINAGNANDISYTLNAPGATLQSVQTKLEQYVSVKDFGAVGDGVTDDTAALQAFLDACQDGRGYIPPGIYRITSALILQPQYSYNIEGAVYDNAGTNGTVIYNDGTGNAIELDNEPYSPPNFDSEIRFAHLVVDGNPSSQNGFFVRHAMIYLEYVWCRGHGTNGIWLERGYSSAFRQVVCANNNENGMFVRIAGNALHFDHCVFNGNGATVSGCAGLYLTGQDPDGYDFGVVATACDFTGNGTSVAVGYGVIAQYCRGVSFIGCYGEQNKSYNLYADTTTKNLTVTGCYWQDGDVYIENVSGLVYENNHHNRTSTATNVRISAGLPSGRYENRIFGNTYNGGAVEAFTNGASSNVSIRYSAPPSGGTWKLGDTVWNNNIQNGGGLLGWICITAGTPGTWAQIGQIPSLYTDWGDADATLTVGASFPTNMWRTPFTGNHTVTLSNTNAFSGAKFRVTRTAGATGAFTLDVGGLKSLAAGQWCDVEWGGGAWALTAFGSL